MKQRLLLRKYEYAVPASPIVLSAISRRSDHFSFIHEPLMNVVMDFEQGYLHLESDWQFMLAASMHTGTPLSTYYKGRIFVKATLSPAFPINLSETENHGLMVLLDGCIADGVYLDACAGLLMVEKNREQCQAQWNITLDICDLPLEHCTLQFRWPVYSVASPGLEN